MGKIMVEELDTPEAYVMKYIAAKIGLNIRAEDAIFDEGRKEWTVPLSAVVPSRVTLEDLQYKTFIYRFENIGNAIVKKENNNFDLIEIPSSNEIESKLRMQFTDITRKMEQTLLRVGQTKWGQLDYVEYFLKPLYKIINRLLNIGEVAWTEIEKHHAEKHLEMLERQEFVRLEKSLKGVYVVPTNFLTSLSERVISDSNRDDHHRVAQEVVGIVFAKEYGFIHSNLNIRVPTAYVDITKTYYLDAVAAGQAIPMTLSQLESKYRVLEHTSSRRFGFDTVVAELVSKRLLAKRNNDVIADKDVFEQVIPLRDEILSYAIEV